MFVSIHADSVRDRSVSGSSVYVLSLRGASDEAARWLAEQENAADLKGGVSLDDKNDVLASVLLDVTQKEAVSDSVEAADSVLACTARGRQGARPAACSTPASSCSSRPTSRRCWSRRPSSRTPTDERRLRDTRHQQRIAEAIQHRRAQLLATRIRRPARGSRRSLAAQRSGRHRRTPQTSPSASPRRGFAILAAPPRGPAAPCPSGSCPSSSSTRSRPARSSSGRRRSSRNWSRTASMPAHARSRSRSRKAAPSLCRVRDDGAGIARRRTRARARASRDQQDRQHRRPRGRAHAGLSRRGPAEHRLGVAHAA